MVSPLDLLKTLREPYLLLRDLAMKDLEMTVLRVIVDVLVNEVDQDPPQAAEEAVESNAQQALLESTVMYPEVELIAVPYETEAETAIAVREMSVTRQRGSDPDPDPDPETEAVDVTEVEIGTVTEREAARVELTTGEILDGIEVVVGTVIVRDEEAEVGTRIEIVSVGEVVAGVAEGSRGDDCWGCDDKVNVKKLPQRCSTWTQ